MSDARQREDKKGDRVNEMIEDSLVPNLIHAVTFDCRFQGMSAKSAEGDRKKAKSGRESDEQGRHLEEETAIV
jgi:hypothetical protein